MDITFYGRNCFRIAERGHTSVVTDPHKPAKGAAPLKLRAELVTLSHERGKHRLEQVADYSYVIAGPGEYEIGELFVSGIPLHVYDEAKGKAQDNVAYLFEYPNQLNVLHLGKLRGAPDEAIVEQFGEVNVLLLPVSDRGGLDDERLTELVSLIEPNYVVPMAQADKQSAADSAIEAFIKAMDKEADERDVLRVTQNSLEEPTQVIALRPAVPLL